MTRRDAIYPLAKVERGQRGIGYTVFAADRAEPFGVEILGIMEGMLGPGEDVVLAKLTGDKIRFTGVVAGMSGSPVYIDGKLLGAVAYRFGSFTREPIAGITPIERMLPLLDAAPAEAASRAPRGPSEVPVVVGPERGRAFRGERALGSAPELIRPVGAGLTPLRSAGLTPIGTPVSAGGLHPGALARLQQAIGPAGLRATAAGRGPERGSNGPSRAGAVPAAPIRPGAPIAALLTRGDVNLSAIGTVTFVDGADVLGFGHPFVGQGTVAFPMATAAILNTLASEAGSYKQGLAAREVGVVSQDRLTAISGRLGGGRAELVPLEVEVRDAPGGPVQRTSVEIVDSPVWLPMLTDTVVSSAVLKRIGAEAGGTVRMRAGIEVGGRFLEVRDAYSAPSPTRVAAYASRDVAQLLAIVSRNGLEPAEVERVRVRMDVTREVRLLELSSARLLPSRARPGDTVRVEVRARPYRGLPRTLDLELQIPEGAAPGEVQVRVGGGLELDLRDAEARGGLEPTSLDALLGILADRRPAQAVYARIYAPQRGVRLGATVLPDAPASLRAALGSHAALEAASVAETPGPEARRSVPEVVGGAIDLSLDILPPVTADREPAP